MKTLKVDSINLLNKLSEDSQSLNNLILEIDFALSNERWLSVFLLTAILIENKIKLALNDYDIYGLHRAILKAQETKKINQLESKTLLNFNEFRNIIFHNQHEAHGIEIGGVTYLLSETETFREYLDLEFTNVLLILVKL